MHDARTRRVADAGHLGIAREEPLHESARSVAGAGMHDETGRLVDHHDIVVGIHDVHCDGVVGRERFVRRRGRSGDLDRRPFLDAL